MDEKDELIEKQKIRIRELLDENEQLRKGVIDKQQVYTPLEYESLRDKAMDMAYTLKKIDKETHMCAMCGGDEENGYSTQQYLKNICEILFSSQGYYKQEL